MSKRKNNYSEYNKDQLIEFLENQDKKIEKYKENEKTYEKYLKLKDKQIEELKKEKENWLEIEENAELYATASQIKHYMRLYEEYKDLYTKQYNSNKEMRKSFQDEIKNNSEMKSNSRKAGRKPIPQEIENTVIKLKKLHPSYSCRKISEVLKQDEISISFNKVSEILRNS